jgi:ankyrin repeat protein
MENKTVRIITALFVLLPFMVKGQSDTTFLDRLSDNEKSVKKNIDSFFQQGGSLSEVLSLNQSQALDCKNIFVFEYLVRLGKLPFDYKIDSNFTTFTLGCKCGNVFLIGKGLDSNISLNEKYQDGMTALMYAIESGKADAVEKIVQKKPDVNIFNDVGLNALHLTSKLNDDVQIVKILLSIGADQRIRGKLYKNTDSLSAIEIACLSGNKLVYNFLYSNIKDDVGFLSNTRLINFAIGGFDTLNLKTFLNSFGKKTTEANCDYLNSACHFSQGYSIDNKYRQKVVIDQSSPLYNTKDLDIDLFKILKRYGYDLTGKDSLGQNPLIKCFKIYPVIKFFVSEKVDVNCIDNLGKTALEYFIDDLIEPEKFNLNGAILCSKDDNRNYKDEMETFQFYDKQGAFVGKGKKNGWVYLYEKAVSHNNSYLLKHLKKHHKRALKAQGLL